MSRNNNNNNGSINNSASITPCCKVCKDAGKPESEYSSHWVKNKEGKVICPYIKGLNCNYCMNYGNASQATGHTPKYCQFLKKNTEKKSLPLPTPPPSKQKSVKSVNKFAVFDDSDSGEDNDVVPQEKVVDLYPVLSGKIKATTKSISVKFSISYAEKLATVVPKSDTTVSMSQDEEPITPQKMSAFINSQKYNKHTSWADASDSE